MDSIRALPFLIAAFAVMELLEKHSDKFTDRLFFRFRKAGPVIGGILGLFPQCGFSAAMSNLYAGSVITLGTLIAVFLSTSDEAVLIMLSSPESVVFILPLLAAKLVIAVTAGFIIDAVFKGAKKEPDIEVLCTGCGCHEKKGILMPVLIHTRNVMIWLLLISFILNLLLESIGSDQLAKMLGDDMLLQPLVTALVGLIPNCAVSVMFTKLYLAGSLSFASTIAGLSSGAGLGLIVLFRMDTDKREALKVVSILYVCAAAAGIILRIAGL